MALKFRVLIICGLFLISGLAIAGAKEIPPMETLKGPIDQIISILNDATYNNADKRAVQRQRIWEIASPVFNFNEISRRAVGKPWAKFSPEEKSRFSSVFSEFFRATYIDKLQGEFNDEQVVFDKELVKGPKALVRTRLRRQSIEIPIDYRMHQVNGTWKIYDILIDNGVSLVKNYRVQFTSMLKNNTPAQLIESLEKKLTVQKSTSN